MSGLGSRHGSWRCPLLVRWYGRSLTHPGYLLREGMTIPTGSTDLNTYFEGPPSGCQGHAASITGQLLCVPEVLYGLSE
jgi:hypothetical protein